MKRKSLDRRLAKQYPERVFDSPRDIVAETLFTKGEKLGTLNCWRLSIIDDLSANAVASQRAQILGQIEEAKCRLTNSPA